MLNSFPKNRISSHGLRNNKVNDIYKSIGSSISPSSILKENELEEANLNHERLIEETSGVSQNQRALCQDKIGEIFKQPDLTRL